MMSIRDHLTFLRPTGVQPERPLFVFLPGMDGTGALLETQLSGLLPWFDIRCLVLPQDTQHRWDDLAEAIAHRITQELHQSPFPDREVYLCGESFGGCLASKVAVLVPTRIDRLILVNPASSFNRRIWTGWAVDIVKALPTALYPMACSILLPFLANLNRMTPSAQQTLLAAMQSVGYDSAAHRVMLLKDFSLTEAEYRRIQIPTLIIASQRDRMLPSMVEAHRLTSLIPQATIHALPYSGHACLLEKPVNLLEIMKSAKFLGGDRSPALSLGDRPGA